jgi:hypothetical protein
LYPEEKEQDDGFAAGQQDKEKRPPARPRPVEE